MKKFLADATKRKIPVVVTIRTGTKPIALTGVFILSFDEFGVVVMTDGKRTAYPVSAVISVAEMAAQPPKVKRPSASLSELQAKK